MNVKWHLKPIAGGGWAGIIEIPLDAMGPVAGGGRVMAAAKGSSKAEALSKAGAIADKIMENPVVAALMPPQAAVAVKAIKVLSKSAAAGKLAEAAAKFSGPAMGRLKKAFGGLF